jgi:DNA-binding NtrC family response regulator
MKVKSLRFSGRVPGTQPLQTEMDVGLLFAAQTTEDLPVAYVVRVQDLAHLREFKSDIVDRGTKHKAKGLSGILLGHRKIPLVDGNFSEPGQLRRSVRTLLINAATKGERNLYIIGTEKPVFEVLWDQAHQAHGNEAIQYLEKDDLPVPADTKPAPVGDITSRLLLEMLDSCEVPYELTQRFKGKSVEVQLVRQFILRAAQVDARVLVIGDTGTGKEVVARAIHDFSRRRNEKFTSINCSGIPRELLESELFGHEKGAFTGATARKIGLWEIAHQGTLFLDEISDLPPEHQAKILRALQEGEIRRIGGQETISIDARVIAATNRDLYPMVLAGQFREDLYYRLREFLIRTPALRDRPEDIPILANHFWGKIAGNGDKGLPGDILKELQTYGWMGNARELKTVLTYLHSLFGEEHLSVERLRAIVHFYSGNLLPEGDSPGSRENGRQRVQSLSHLRRADEIINACAASLRPILARPRTDRQTIASLQASLRLRLNELEMICMYPLLFKNEAIFSQVNLFKGKLTYFQSLIQDDAEEALRFWTRDGAEVLHQVQSAITSEINRLLSNVA